MKIAIVGGRNFKDYESMKIALELFFEENDVSCSSVVSGGARGADTLAEKFAEENSFEMVVFKPDYEKFGRAATLQRNTQIIENADTVFAFWNGLSRGTYDSIKKAEKLCKKLIIINY